MLNTISGMLAGGVTGTDYESIQTVTLSSSQASITFSSIPSTYSHLQIRGISRTNNPGSIDNVIIRFNSDTGTNYSWHQLDGNGSSATSAGESSVNYILIGVQPSGSTNSSTFAGSVVDILDYGNTNKNKTVRGLNGFDLNGSGELVLRSGLWRNTAAITSITLSLFDVYTYNQYSSFALYGIK